MFWSFIDDLIEVSGYPERMQDFWVDLYPYSIRQYNLTWTYFYSLD